MFCSSNETSTGGGMIVWIEKGFSLCFYDTATASILFGFIFIFGLIQYTYYRYVYVNNITKNQRLYFHAFPI